MGFYNRQESGKPLKIRDEGVLLSNAVASIDFVGAGVIGSIVGEDVTETISGVPGTPVVASIGSGLTGDINDINKDFVIANTPISGTLKVFVGGARQKETEDYTVSGTTISFVLAPQTGSIILVDYSYL